MAVKILIQRKITGKENELGEAIRELRSKAIHAPGYISGRPCALSKTLLYIW
jgi:hypothetical protein